MFKLNPVNKIFKEEVELPNCMFKMKGYQDRDSTDGGFSSERSGDPEIDKLEEKQEKILLELKKLEQEVNKLQARLHDEAPVASLVTVSTAKVQRQSQGNVSTASRQVQRNNIQKPQEIGDVIHDMVIYANPVQPPYSLFILHQILLSQYTCRTAVHIHSSVNSVQESLMNCFSNGVNQKRSDVQLGLTLVWKDVQHGPLLIVNPSSQTPICGESNIARYIARLLQPRYDAGSPDTASMYDQWLDLASASVINGNAKERSAAVRNLNSHFGKASWLVGNQFSFVDAVMWGALRSTNQISSAPGNVKKWLKACESLQVFQSVLSLEVL